MRKSLSTKAFQEILRETSALHRETVEAALDRELAKPDEKMNTDLVEELTDILLRMERLDQDMPNLTFDSKSYAHGPLPAGRRRLKALPARLRVVVSFSIVLVFPFVVNTVSTIAFDFNIASEFATWTKDAVVLRYANDTGTAEEMSSAEIYSLLQQNMSDNGYVAFLWPSELPSDMKVDSMRVESTLNEVNIMVSLVKGEDSVSISIVNQKISKLDPDIDNNEVEIEGYFTSGLRKTINGRTVFLLSNKNINQLCYMDEFNTYIISTTYDVDVLESIFASM